MKNVITIQDRIPSIQPGYFLATMPGDLNRKSIRKVTGSSSKSGVTIGYINDNGSIVADEDVAQLIINSGKVSNAYWAGEAANGSNPASQHIRDAYFKH